MPKTPSRRVRRLHAAAALLPLLAACQSPEPPASAAARPWPRAAADALATGDWPTYNRDLAGTRFSWLRQITVERAASLREAWRVPIGPGSAAAELTPLVVAGVMYAATADGVVALRADTGVRIWRFATPLEPLRSLAYWPGDGGRAARLYFVSGTRLIALDAATGVPVAAFGREGVVDLRAPYRYAPTLFEDLLIVGSSGPPGGVRAYDVRTGAEVWSFSGVPQTDEPEAATWQGDSARASVAHDAAFTLDVDRGLVFAVFGGPDSAAADAVGRGGDRLFASSIVALDARTGARRWHFQTVRNDVWGYGLRAAPVLVDTAASGSSVPLVVAAGATGHAYVLNRATGVPHFGVEERAVAQSEAPGELLAPAQPIPVLPPPIARVTYAQSDLVTAADTTAEHAAACAALVAESGVLDNRGVFTPFAYRAPEAPPRTTLLFPGVGGGAGWGGAAVDPVAGLVFVNTSDLGSLGWLDSSVAASGDVVAVGGVRRPFSADAGQASGASAWPCQKPPWGRLLALEAGTGKIAWQVSLGTTDALPEDRRRTGRPNVGGPIATAGGLVFIGAADDRRLRAFDSRTGAELWAAELPASAQAVPITYEAANGKQYVAVVAGADAGGDTGALIAFALP